ncbi:MAG: chloride channel protein [Desulfamplus sp.]|nr:chloride channel protein [Desulfamplus sp.]
MKKFTSWRRPGTFSIFLIDDRLLLICIGIIVGLCSGLAALALNSSLIFMMDSLHNFRHYWWAFLLPATGALFSSIFLKKIIKEDSGHGVPEVIYSVSRYGGLLKFRSTFSRLVASCLTIGSGGSAGPEAPVVVSGSAIGSNIATFFSFNERQRITLVGCGAAGAIASIFNAPLTGIIFTMEIILGEWSMVNIIPIAVASVAGAEISRHLRGNIIAFESSTVFHLSNYHFIACVGLAVCASVASIIFTRYLRAMHKVSQKVILPFWLKAAIGGASVGAIGFVIPEVMGEGYHTIHEMIAGIFKEGLGIAVIGCLAKILATSLTLGWGGSGGIFAPSLVIGSFAGLAYHRLLVYLFPSITWVNEGCFALLGMAGMISGILQAPLTGIFLILEITGGYDVMLSLIVVSALSTTITHYAEPASFYLKELTESGKLLRPGTDSRVLADISIREVIEKDCIPVSPNMLLREFIHTVKQSTRNYFPVEEPESGKFIGMIQLDQIKPYIFNTLMYDTVLVEQIMDTNPETVSYDDELSDVLRKMDMKRCFSLPVIYNGRFEGMISKATLLDKYRDELNVQTSHSF